MKMDRVLSILLASAIPFATLANENPFVEPNILVVHATLDSLARTSGPQSIIDGDTIKVPTSCGYDTAVLSVQTVLLGQYPHDTLVAHQPLGEFCEGIWQQGVTDYFVFLRWNGSVWEADRALSSPLIRSDDKDWWLVEPPLLATMQLIGVPTESMLVVERRTRVRMSVARLTQAGSTVDPGVSDDAFVADALSTCKGDYCWSIAPMTYARGIPLKKARALLSSIERARE